MGVLISLLCGCEQRGLRVYEICALRQSMIPHRFVCANNSSLRVAERPARCCVPYSVMLSLDDANVSACLPSRAVCVFPVH